MKTAGLLCSALAGLLLAASAIARPPVANPEIAAAFRDDPRLAPIKNVQRRAMLSRQAAKLAKSADALRHPAKHRKGSTSRPPRLDPDEGPVRREPGPGAARLGERLAGGAALAPNVLVNNPNGIPPDQSDHGQAEAALAAMGNDIVVAWNDGSGFDFASGDIQGWGYSVDGGQTFVDRGAPPKPANWTWNSDPVVTVNEKTGVFYYCALADSFNASFSASLRNAIIVLSGSFAGDSFHWNAPVFAIKVSSASIALDKQWIAADSATGNVYIAYTNFNNTTGSHIEVVRSTNGGTVWTAPVKLSSDDGDGLVHGVRVGAGPNGEVYTVWSEIGPIDVDFFRIRASTNGGVSWGSEQTLPSYYANFGTGAPGFNRERGITFPGLAVDRTSGPNRGRIYVTWNESINWYDDLAGGGGGQAEIEPNDTAAQATPFSLGQTLTGNISSVTPTADLDFFRFTGNQGDDVVLRLQPGSTLDLAWRLLCTDGVTRLAISNFGIGAEAYIVFTLPTSGTYYVRPAPFSTSGTGNYTIRTQVSTPGPERARDHRDIFVSASSDQGVSWSTPARANADPGWFDDWLPEVAVANDGNAYAMWYDWRDTPAANCGGWSNIYLSRSVDGGASWSELGIVTDQSTPWTTVASNIAPNQGDYNFLGVSGVNVYPLWADGRNGNPDIFISAVPVTTASAPTLVSLDAQASGVTLTWSALGNAGATATVYRRDPAGSFASIASLTVGGNDRVTYTDTAVAPGERWIYRLGVGPSGSETFSSEVDVTVPAAGASGVQLAITAVGPNPVTDDLWVSFVLPVAGAATLDLLDITGRLIRRLDVGGAAGPQRVALLESGDHPAMGIHVVRLRQGDNEVTRRVSLVR